MRRRFIRRRPFIRKRRVIRRRRVPARHRNNGTRFFKFSYQVGLSNTQVSTAINDDPSASPSGTPAAVQFAALRVLFGFYRCNAIKIVNVPNFTVAPTNVTQSNSRVLVYQDWDSLGNTTRAELMNREATRAFEAMKPWKFYRKTRRTFPVIGASNIVQSNSWIATENPVPTQRILVNAGESNNGVVGSLRVTLYCAFRQRI